jgi:hypothetical protein
LKEESASNSIGINYFTFVGLEHRIVLDILFQNYSFKLLLKIIDNALNIFALTVFKNGGN